MYRKEKVSKIYNGIYKMLLKEDYSLIMEAVNELDKKVNDPLLKAVLNYEKLPVNEVLSILSETFQFFKRYYGVITKENADELFTILLGECNESLSKHEQLDAIDGAGRNAYLRKIMVILVAYIEEKYKEDSSD